MSPMSIAKYRPYQPVDLPDRQWPGQTITKAPIWCSVDLRDGNQALIEPMGRHRKLRFFHHLIKLGYKEIEVGFPAASETDFDFCRHIIDNDLIPDDVSIQVLTQSREPLIRRSIEAVAGAKNVIIHLYNSTSTLQRRVVFGLDRAGIQDIAVQGTRLVKELAPRLDGANVRFQYSPESFTGTELDFALDVCHAVMDVWRPTVENKIIFNLPATVEMASPNIYADQIEWMHRHFKERDKIILSLHPHNDRGTAIAATELALMAGAQRVEGTLFGNGERTGNVDLVALALNMFTQGVDPGIDFSNITDSIEVAEFCNQLPVHQRHPYAGELVYTAFSGSHQDAIKKGMAALAKSNSGLWEVPYLPIDPKDVGRTYEAIIRINSQSGKGGIAFVMDQEFGFEMPRELQIEFSQVIQDVSDESGKEIAAGEIYDQFKRAYLDRTEPFALIDYRIGTAPHASEITICDAAVKAFGVEEQISGRGNGPINAFMHAMKQRFDLKTRLLDYHQHAISDGSDAVAACYIKMGDEDGKATFGVGLDSNTNTASLKAIISAINRLSAS